MYIGGLEATRGTTRAIATSLKETPSTVVLERDSLAILSALEMCFSDELNTVNKKESYKRVYELVPVMIACNDYCDIGLAAQKRAKSAHPEKQYPLLDLYSRLGQNLEKQLQKITESDPGFDRPIRTYVEDSVTLAQNRFGIDTNDIPTYLEIDSAIFEAISIEAAIPGLLQKTGFDLYAPATNLQELKEKYAFFIEPPDKADSETQRKVKGLQAIEMVLKVADDFWGGVEDSILEVPSYLQFCEEQTECDKETAKNNLLSTYRKNAQLCGVSNFVTNFSDLIFKLARKAKLHMKKKTVPSTSIEKIDILMRNYEPTMLREYLCESSILADLFT